MGHESEGELIVHVGLAKTGTTAIQGHMSRNRDAFAARGVHWVETYPNGLDELNDLAHHVYSHKWGGWLDVSQFVVTPDEAWQALGKSIREKGGRHAISSERFADVLSCPRDGPDMLRFIVDAVAPARVKLIGYVRRQDKLIESHIREWIEGAQFRSLDHYLADIPIFVFFDDCFVKAAEILGRENVMVRVYERDRLVRRDVVADFLETCGISEVDPDRDSTANLNPSLNFLTARVLSDPRVMEAFPPDSRERRFLLDYFNQKSFGTLNGYALLSAETRANLMRRYEGGNARLAEMFLSEDDAKALRYDAVASSPTLSDDDLVLTHQQLIDVLLAFRPRHGSDASGR